MKRGKKLLILTLVLVVLGGAAWILTLLDLNGTAEEEDTSVAVMTLDAESVTALSYTNLDEDTMAFTSGDDGWSYDADTAFPLDGDMIDTMVSVLSEVTASRSIDEPEDAANYGLSRPMCVIEITAGEESYTLELGDETTLGGERYASIGDGKVYLVDSSLLDEFDYELYDLVLEETLPEALDVTALRIDAETQTLNIVYLEDSGLAYSDSYVWFAQGDDGYTTLDTDLTEDLISEYQDFTWQECINYNADDDALAEYGLDAPTAIIELDYDTEDGSETLSLEVGDYNEDGDVYARLTGSHMVYLVDASVSDSALYTTLDTLLPDEVIDMDFDTLTSLEVDLDGETYTITCQTVTETDDDGNETESIVYYLGEEQVYLEDTLELLEDVSSNGYATGVEPERALELTLRLYREDENFPVVELCFYRYDSSSCITQLNGVSTVYAVREDVVDLIEEINSVVLE